MHTASSPLQRDSGKAWKMDTRILLPSPFSRGFGRHGGLIKASPSKCYQTREKPDQCTSFQNSFFIR